LTRFYARKKLSELLLARGELLVGFSPTATAGEITELLKRLDAVLTDGPRAGLYRLRFPDAKSGDEDRKAAIEALEQSGMVTIVLPGR
jgi:hypothetical protein